MIKSILLHATILAVLLFSLCSVASATQVVTPQLSEWAKTAIQQEGKLIKRQQPNSIAVLYFSNQTDNPKYNLLQKGLALMLTTDLTKISGLHVLERVKLQALLNELDLGQTALVAPDTTPKIGKLLAVQHLVGGSFFQEKLDEIKIDSELFRVPFGETFYRVETKGLFEDIFKLEKEILFKIVAALPTVIPSEKEKIELRKPLTSNIDALFAFFSGLEHSDNGEYVKAQEFYQKALQKDPHFTVAKKAMVELGTLGLTSSKRTRNLGISLRKKVALPGALATENLHRERTPATVDDLVPLKEPGYTQDPYTQDPDYPDYPYP